MSGVALVWGMENLGKERNEIRVRVRGKAEFGKVGNGIPVGKGRVWEMQGMGF